MSNAKSLLFFQIPTAIALGVAALLGETTVHVHGLHVCKLAHDAIGLTIMATCLMSCVVASFALFGIVRSWTGENATVFLLACVTGWLSASSYGNAGPGFSINGVSPKWISRPATVWLVMLMCVAAVSLLRHVMLARKPPDPYQAPDVRSE
ncbi:MAG: hypothetical protein ACYSU0_02295 [Planctomycetota bacterium]|jgi:hypothetical protein